MHGFTKVANSAFYLPPSLSPLTFHPSTFTFPSHFSPVNSHFALSLFTLQLTFPSHFSPLNPHCSLSLFYLSTLTFPSHFSPLHPVSLYPLTFHPSNLIFPLTFHTSILTFPSHISSPTFIPLSFFTTQLSIFPSHFSPFNSLSPLQSAFSCFFSCAYCWFLDCVAALCWGML